MVVDLKNSPFASNLDTNRHLRKGFGVAILDFKGIDTTSQTAPPPPPPPPQFAGLLPERPRAADSPAARSRPSVGSRLPQQAQSF
jgi:hypothetical protein